MRWISSHLFNCGSFWVCCAHALNWLKRTRIDETKNVMLSRPPLWNSGRSSLVFVYSLSMERVCYRCIRGLTHRYHRKIVQTSRPKTCVFLKMFMFSYLDLDITAITEGDLKPLLFRQRKNLQDLWRSLKNSTEFYKTFSRNSSKIFFLKCLMRNPTLLNDFKRFL